MGATSSKVIFGNIVNQLITTDVDPADHDFWDELWKAVVTIEDVFEIISADDVRKLIRERPNNLKTLFTQAVAQLFQVVETPYPVYFDQALNCMRFLARLLPIMLETDAKLVKELCWQKQVIPKPLEAAAATAATTPDTSSAATSSGTSATAASSATEDLVESEPLAVILVNAMFHLLFLPDFTIEDPHIDFHVEDINSKEFKTALMWAPGVGSTEKAVVVSTEFDDNRIEVLRMLIAAFSDSLYQNPDSYDSCASMWLEVATSADAPYAEIVLYSLLNTVLGYDPVGWGLPYGNLVAKDTAKPLMEHAVQALLILLDYGHPIKIPGSEGTVEAALAAGSTAPPLPYVAPHETDSQGFNVFRRILGTIEDPAQLNFIFKGFVRLLNNVHESESTYLPYSITRVSIEQELLVLLWKCLEEIPKFMGYISRNCDVTELLVPICYFLLEGRRDPSKVGLIYLCTFTLLKLSGERNFGVSLNKPFQMHLPVDVPLFSGNHSDLLVIVLHKMIVSGLDKLSALYNCFLTIICNVSPYCKCLGTVAAVKLVNLFQLFTSPRFLYAAEGNHAYVALLLETFNNIVQYQYEGNVNLVYAIVRRREIFEQLAGLTLPNAVQSAYELAEKRVSRSDRNGSNSNSHNQLQLQQAASPRGAKPAAAAMVSNTSVGKKATTSPVKAAAAGKKSDLQDDLENVVEDATPTDLISTANVERRMSREGEVEELVKKSETTTTAATATAAAAAGGGGGASGAGRKSATGEDQQQHQHHHPGMRFVPTQAWLEAVKAELPLNTIIRLLRHLVPQVANLAGGNNAVDEVQVLEYIKQTTMVGLLPVPHPIVIRKYQPNKFTCLWFTAFQWGVIFMHNQTVPLFDGKTVKLFMVQTVN